MWSKQAPEPPDGVPSKRDRLGPDHQFGADHNENRTFAAANNDVGESVSLDEETLGNFQVIFADQEKRMKDISVKVDERMKELTERNTALNAQNRRLQTENDRGRHRKNELEREKKQLKTQLPY